MQTQRKFTPEQKQEVLRITATKGLRATAREFELSHSTIHRWKLQFPELWSDLTAGHRDALTERFAARLEGLAEHYTDAEQDALEKAAALIETGDLDAKELAALIKSMGSSRGLAVVNARAVRGEPDSTQQVNINFPQIEQAIERLLNKPADPPALPVPNEA